jgi:site-specific recombinase XerD
MQRVHISPRVGDKAIDRVTVGDVETVAAAMLDAGLAPKTVRNVLTFLHSVFEHAIDRGWASQNPVRRASRPKRRRPGDANPDLQVLTVPELEAVLRAIPDDVVVREPAPTRNGRAGSAPPFRPTSLGR